ncbi:hypothetical protein DFH09DRAFT_1072336 [Mycena vulgaris]|nr:hypothetical protein DFH09DRAFT_1072336 [Mycena vulgaris]
MKRVNILLAALTAPLASFLACFFELVGGGRGNALNAAGCLGFWHPSGRRMRASARVKKEEADSFPLQARVWDILWWREVRVHGGGRELITIQGNTRSQTAGLNSGQRRNERSNKFGTGDSRNDLFNRL